ncbi:MAG: cupin domain-containing protein [Gammaproteobacteria bacterium]
MNSDRYICMAFLASLVLWQGSSVADGLKPSPSDAIVKQLFDNEQTGVPGKELLMLTVEYLPGGASLPHRHDAQVFVYVLEGELEMQVAGNPVVKLRAGQTFYESPSDVHVVSANASKTKPAKFLVFIVKDKGAPVSRAATPRAPT